MNSVSVTYLKKFMKDNLTKNAENYVKPYLNKLSKVKPISLTVDGVETILILPILGVVGDEVHSKLMALLPGNSIIDIDVIGEVVITDKVYACYCSLLTYLASLIIEGREIGFEETIALRIYDDTEDTDNIMPPIFFIPYSERVKNSDLVLWSGVMVPAHTEDEVSDLCKELHESLGSAEMVIKDLISLQIGLQRQMVDLASK